jgi:hypothetical protein
MSDDPNVVPPLPTQPPATQPPATHAPRPPSPTYAPTESPRQNRNPEDTIADLRAESAARRIDARNATERADAALAEIEAIKGKTAAEIEAAKAPLLAQVQKFNERIIGSEIKAAVVEAGIQDIDLVHLPQFDRSKITVDAEGNVKGVKEAVEAFKKAKPEYFRTAPTGNNPPRPTPTQRDNPPPPVNNPEGVAVKDMDKKQYAAFKAGMGRRLRAV